MADIPAFCECGHVFYSGISMSGSNNVLSNCGSRCPKCGKMVTINARTDEKGNLHLFSNTAFRVLTGAAISQHELFQFKAMLKQQLAKKEESQEGQFIESIQQNLPDLQEITKLLTPTNAGEFYSFLSFLLALVTFLILMRGSSKQASSTIINNFYGTTNPEADAYRTAYEQSGIRRKDLCPCGSGKKFKNCHGI